MLVQHQPARILIAEDEYEISQVIRMGLERLGYDIVGEAADGLEAVGMVRALRPDVVVMDIKMPRQDGIAAARQIQEFFTPVVILSAYDSEELVEQAGAAGVTAYVAKPYSLGELQRAITIAIARGEDLRALRRMNAELVMREQELTRLAGLYEKANQELGLRAKEVATLYAVAEMVARSPDLGRILQLALDSAIELAGADAGCIYLLDRAQGAFVLRVFSGFSTERAYQDQSGDDLLAAIGTGVPVRPMNKLPWTDTDLTTTAERDKWSSLVRVPLRTNEALVGLLILYSDRPDAFGAPDLELVKGIAHQLSMAIEKANLQAHELRTAILEERQTIAMQMHDDIAQTLGYLGLRIDNVASSDSLIQNATIKDQLEQIRCAIEDAYERVQSAIILMEEKVPDHLDFQMALAETVNDFERRTGQTVTLELDGGWPAALSPLVASQADYIVREALNNIRKHAQAHSIQLCLKEQDKGMVEIRVRDDGQGFAPGAKSRQGFGLRFMRARAERVGGSLVVSSQPGQGTTVTVCLPAGLGWQRKASG